MKHGRTNSGAGLSRGRRLSLVMVGIATVIVPLLSYTPAASARSTDTPEYAAGLVIGELAAGGAAAAWQHLHPAQQKIVPEQAYVACRASKGTLAIDTTNTRALSKSTAHITIPGTRVKTTAAAVVVKVALTSGQSQNIVVNEVRVKHAWRYLLNASEVAACRAR